MRRSNETRDRRGIEACIRRDEARLRRNDARGRRSIEARVRQPKRPACAAWASSYSGNDYRGREGALRQLHSVIVRPVREMRALS